MFNIALLELEASYLEYHDKLTKFKYLVEQEINKLSLMGNFEIGDYTIVYEEHEIGGDKWFRALIKNGYSHQVITEKHVGTLIDTLVKTILNMEVHKLNEKQI